MIFTRKSPVSGVERTRDLDVTPEQLAAFQEGAHIQHAMPQLSPADREFILTGIDGDEWDELFKEEPEDLDDDEVAF